MYDVGELWRLCIIGSVLSNTRYNQHLTKLLTTVYYGFKINFFMICWVRTRDNFPVSLRCWFSISTKSLLICSHQTLKFVFVQKYSKILEMNNVYITEYFYQSKLVQQQQKSFEGFSVYLWCVRRECEM